MAGSFDKLKVVVIDDNKHMRALLQALLHALGVKHVYGEPDGKSGFATVLAIKPDFVLTDYSMQPVDGIEFVKQLRGLHSPLAWLPVIMITGHNERRYVERARDAGITELLCKPLTARDLYARITEVIERPRKFVKTPDFIGPDRRRKRLPASLYPKRRSSDFDTELEFH